MASKWVRDKSGTFYYVNESTGSSVRASAAQRATLLHMGPKHYQTLNYMYRPGAAIEGANYTSYARDATSGAIYGVTAQGAYTHLSTAQYNQLGRPGYNQYSFNPQQNSSLQLISDTLRQWGLSSLDDTVRGLIVKGDTNPDTLALAISQTPQYKARFAGNAIREKNGLPDLTPAQYLATEESYNQILRGYGLPPGFYDSHSDFTNFIGNDISPAELDARAKIAHDQYMNAPTAVKNLWSQYFGTKGDAIAAILDPKVATTLIQDRATQVAIGGSAAVRGLSVSAQRAKELQQGGVTASAAEQGYSKIAQALPTDEAIAQRFGTKFGQTQEENDLLLGLGPEARQRETLYSEEEGLFKGRPGADAQSAGVAQNY